MQGAEVDVVELGFRTLKSQGLQGSIPSGLTLGVMVNGNELLRELPLQKALQRLFPSKAVDSPLDLVRIACHVFREGATGGV